MDIKTNMVLLLMFIMLLFVWLAMIISDYICVMWNYEKPLFAQAAVTADDGGSGNYRGLGYSIIIEGNFMPEDPDRGVNTAEFYLFGLKAGTVMRTGLKVNSINFQLRYIRD